MIGTGSYDPQPKFAFPRSYVRGVAIQIVSGVVVQTGRFFQLQNPPDPTLYFIVFNEKFWDWSSNRYTLDFVVEESYYQPGGVGSYVPMPFLVTYYTNTPDYSPYLVYSPFSSPGGITYYQLPPAPPDYWLPPFA